MHSDTVSNMRKAPKKEKHLKRHIIAELQDGMQTQLYLERQAELDEEERFEEMRLAEEREYEEDRNREDDRYFDDYYYGYFDWDDQSMEPEPFY